MKSNLAEHAAQGVDNPLCNAQDVCMAVDPKELINSRDACDEIGIDRSTLTRWVQLGKATPVMRLSGATGAYLFARDDVARLKAEYEAVKAAS
jgi:hypothetical protein